MNHIHVGFTVIQQELIGVNNCAVDMLNSLPIEKYETLLIAHNSYYDCIFIFNIFKCKTYC